MLKLISVSKEYDSPDSDEKTPVLQDVSLSLGRGESVSIVGPSGSGKSTLLNIIGALDKPTTGKVELDEINFTKLDENSLAEIRNQRIGFVFQLHHLLPQCTVLENVLVPTIVVGNKNSRELYRQRASELLDRVGLGEFKLYRPGQLSGGQRQRVAVVRALINKPDLLLADEPTGSLDSHTSGKLMDFLLELNKSQNVTLVMVTHAESVAERADRIFQLKQGRLEKKK